MTLESSVYFAKIYTIHDKAQDYSVYCFEILNFNLLQNKPTKYMVKANIVHDFLTIVRTANTTTYLCEAFSKGKHKQFNEKNLQIGNWHVSDCMDREVSSFAQ